MGLANGRGAWLALIRRYLAWTVVSHLAWEIAQLPLYTVWWQHDLAYNAFAVVHCTAGDVVIALSALLLALVAAGTPRWPRARFVPVLAIATAAGAGYTIYSEWLNTGVRLAWAYSDWMPVVPGLGTGLAPLAQWLVLPPLGLWLCARRGGDHQFSV